MNSKKRVRATTWLGAATGVVTAAYGTNIGMTWNRYGDPSPPTPEARDPYLDRFMPAYEVMERNSIRIATPAAVTIATARDMDLQASGLVRVIIRARELLLGATPSDRPHSGGLLAEMQACWPRFLNGGRRRCDHKALGRFRAIPPDQFVTFDEPGYVKIVWTIRADPVGATESIFRTETRVIATDRMSRARFRRYWSFLSPGIIVIHWAVLGLVKDEAERQARKGTQKVLVAGHDSSRCRSDRSHRASPGDVGRFASSGARAVGADRLRDAGPRVTFNERDSVLVLWQSNGCTRLSMLRHRHAHPPTDACRMS